MYMDVILFLLFIQQMRISAFYVSFDWLVGWLFTVLRPAQEYFT
jgi:hypothetical protein